MTSDEHLDLAERACIARGARMTALRREVLALALRCNGVVKAYQLLADMQKDRGVLAPPTVYRALEFLVAQGLLHRVDALNGFVVCKHFSCPHQSVLLVCEACGGVSEVDANTVLDSVREVADNAGFSVRMKDIVLTGQCASCCCTQEKDT